MSAHPALAAPPWLGRIEALLPGLLRRPVKVALLAAIRWIDVSGPQLGASIAFYTMFALAPLLVITIAIAGAAFGSDAARGQIVGEIQNLVGTDAAQAIEALIANAWRRPGGLLAAAIGVATLLIGATSVFAELRRALNAIGAVSQRSGSRSASAIRGFLRVRLIAFALLLGFGFLAIASLLVSAMLAAASSYLSNLIPGGALIASAADFVISIIVLGIVFAALLRWLPDRAPSRRAVWLSALVSAGLFAVGKSLIGLYLGQASVTSSYGAAGSFVVVLLWVYYSAQILLYGAAVGRVFDELTLAAGAAGTGPRTSRDTSVDSRNGYRPDVPHR